MMEQILNTIRGTENIRTITVDEDTNIITASVNHINDIEGLMWELESLANRTEWGFISGISWFEFNNFTVQIIQLVEDQ